MNVVALIPARSGSKGVIDKNIKPLSGHPLIAFSIIAAKLSKKIICFPGNAGTEKIAENIILMS